MGIKQFILELQIILPHKLMYSLHQLLQIPLKNLSRIKNLLLVNGFIANTLMALKEETYTTDPSTTRVIISPEDIPGSNISSFASPGPTQIIQNNNTQLPLSGDNESEFNTFDQLPIID